MISWVGPRAKKKTFDWERSKACTETVQLSPPCSGPPSILASDFGQFSSLSLIDCDNDDMLGGTYCRQMTPAPQPQLRGFVAKAKRSIDSVWSTIVLAACFPP